MAKDTRGSRESIDARLRFDEESQFAAFEVGDGAYAIDIMRIKEVVHAAPYKIRRVPNAIELIEGVIELRGVVIPVIDVRRRFGMEQLELDELARKRQKLVIVSIRGRIAALRVDRVVGEVRVATDEIRPAPSMVRGNTQSDFFSGLCHAGDLMIFVLNLEALMGLETRRA